MTAILVSKVLLEFGPFKTFAICAFDGTLTREALWSIYHGPTWVMQLVPSPRICRPLPQNPQTQNSPPVYDLSFEALFYSLKSGWFLSKWAPYSNITLVVTELIFPLAGPVPFGNRSF